LSTGCIIYKAKWNSQNLHVFIQLRAATTGGNVIASDVQQISIDEILQEGAIT
jgi:hypothetical protein